MNEFKEATGLKYKWFDVCTNFFCTCGEELVVDRDAGDTVCECGRTYRITAKVEVKEHDMAKMP